MEGLEAHPPGALVAVYQYIYSVTDVAQTYREFLATIEDCKLTDRVRARAGLPPITLQTQAVLYRSFNDFEKGLRHVAQRGATNAQQAMRDTLDARIGPRGSTGRSPHLKQRVTARALPPLGGTETGAVGVAPEEVLNRAVDPLNPQYGAYWRAIEFGTANQQLEPGDPKVPSQKGRVIKGYFFEAGYGGSGEPPRATYQQGGPHPLFVSARAGAQQAASIGFSSGIGPRGGAGGYGTIKREIVGKHFIRDGAARAATEWKREMAALQARTIGSIAGALRP